jgi:hypothetical protein
MKKERECFSIRAGGFHTSMDSLDALPGKPLTQLLKARSSVGKDFMLELALLLDKADVEL